MSANASFADIFRQASAKTAANANPPAVAYSTGSTLAAFGSASVVLQFTATGIEFMNTGGKATTYSWEQLDFVLPGDLSLSSDKLYTFCDLDAPAARIAGTVGRFFAWAAAGVFVYVIGTIFYDLVISPIIWLHVNLGIFGDVLAMLAVIAFFMIVGWWLLAGFGAMLAAGGGISALARWAGKQFKPLIKGYLQNKYANVQNGLHIVRDRWVDMPWNPPTTCALDLIFIGIKLRRRGLA